MVQQNYFETETEYHKFLWLKGEERKPLRTPDGLKETSQSENVSQMLCDFKATQAEYRDECKTIWQQMFKIVQRMIDLSQEAVHYEGNCDNSQEQEKETGQSPEVHVRTTKLLKSTLEESLENGLFQWKQKIMDELILQLQLILEECLANGNGTLAEYEPLQGDQKSIQKKELNCLYIGPIGSVT